MDDLKVKFMDLIRHQKNSNKIPIIDCEQDLKYDGKSLVEKPMEAGSNRNLETRISEEINSDSDILDNVDHVYFTNDFNPSRYELEKLNGSIEMDLIENNLHKLQAQLAVISKRVLHMILENQSLCVEEFNKMQGLHKSLTETLSVCQHARSDLSHGQKSFTTASLGILSNYKKRKTIQDLLRSLNTIKTLLQTETRLVKLLNEGNFSDAISLLLECQQVALTYKHFQCVAALSRKLQDTLVMAEEQLDVALTKICFEFNGDVYSRLQAAYSQLGKRRIAMDQLHMHYTSAIHSSAFNVIRNYIVHENSPNMKKPYIQLCQQVDDDKLITCLLKLCQSMWCILRSYNQVVQWHNRNQFVTSDCDFEQNINEQYIKQKLESGLGKLWHDIQSRVSILISNSKVTDFKFDDFLQVLGILHKLVQIGEEFCGSDSAEIQSSIKDQSRHYFQKYHLSRLEELRLFLENEAWTPCPVKPNFNLLHLQEFKNLRNVVQNARSKNHKRTDSSDCASSNISSGYFNKFSEIGTPFDVYSESDSSQLQLDEDILLVEDNNSAYCTEESDEEDVIRKNNEFNRNSYFSSKQNKNSILLTNTTLTVLRHCGRYLQMSRLLRAFTSDVLLYLGQLFEYYLYAVCTFFTANLHITSCSSILYSIQKLTAVLKRIEDSLIKDDEKLENNHKVVAPSISPAVDLLNPETLYGLTERIVGVESLIFLAEQYNLLCDYLKRLISEENDIHALELFYSQTISVAVEVRKPVYECVARQVIDSKNIINLMSKVNWEVKDVMCQHSQYVDVLFKDLQVFVLRLEAINVVVPISADVVSCLWHSIAEILAEIFVEGFSNAKRCSNGGRALMQLDFTQLMSKLEMMSSIKPIPKREYVENYVKAYYLPEKALQDWIQNHPEYTSKQLQCLVNCTLYNNKKAKQRLMMMIEEMDRR